MTPVINRLNIYKARMIKLGASYQHQDKNGDVIRLFHLTKANDKTDRAKGYGFTYENKAGKVLSGSYGFKRLADAKEKLKKCYPHIYKTQTET